MCPCLAFVWRAWRHTTFLALPFDALFRLAAERRSLCCAWRAARLTMRGGAT
jgi:hypothetical protein